MSTSLFSFYINDCIKAVTCLDIGCSIGFKKCNVLAYADDITLIAPSAKGLQTLIDVMSFSLRNICLKINVKKSMYMLFKCRKRSTVESSVHLFAEPLKRVFEFKYLGIILTDDMSIGRDAVWACWGGALAPPKVGLAPPQGRLCPTRFFKDILKID